MDAVRDRFGRERGRLRAARAPRRAACPTSSASSPSATEDNDRVSHGGTRAHLTATRHPRLLATELPLTPTAATIVGRRLPG